ncbi:unnamed protein product [Xylocopa violacea]|uniref:Uncharacterized protein n=2 Tax=Xylocopa violacea TaxID=135666 RepID=A0ABP1P363_XYLVO
MNQNATRRFFWAMLFTSFCTVIPKILTSDNSCPCSLSSECPDDSQLLHESSQVLILPCESERLIRCCSLIPRPIESGVEFSYNVDQEEKFVTEKGTTEHSTEASTQITGSEMSDVTYESTDKSWEEYSTVKWLSTDFPTEESTSDVTVLPLTTEVPTDISTMDMNDLGDKNDEPATTTENITTFVGASKEQRVPPEWQERLYSNSKQILRSQSAQSRILNKDLTSESSTIRSPYPEHRQLEKKGTSEVLSNAQEQDLIEQVMNFESTKIASEASHQVELVASEFKERKEKSVPGRYKLLFPRRAVLGKDYRAKVNVRFLSVPKSVSEKNQQLFQAENMISDTLYTR